MTEPSLAPSSPLQLMLADADPIFRLGFKSALAHSPDLQIVAEAESPAEVMSLLSATPPADSSTTDPTNLASSDSAVFATQPLSQTLDLVIVDMSNSDPDPQGNAIFCQQLKARYPGLALFVLSGQGYLPELITLWKTGVEGFSRKSTIDLATLGQQLQRAAAGERVWEAMPKAQVQMAIAPQSALPSLSRQNLSAFTLLRQVFMETGLRQLEQSLVQLQERRQRLPLTPWQASINAGRTRELQTVQWMIRRFLETRPTDLTPTETDPATFADWDLDELPRSVRVTQVTTTNQSNALATASVPGIKGILVDAVLAKLPTSLQNRTPIPLEIDILKPQKRQDLLVIVLQRFEHTLDELEFSQVTRSQLLDKRSPILRDLWQASTTDFFGKYLTLPLSQAIPEQDASEMEIVHVLHQDQGIVEGEILHKIPLVPELLDHLLFQTPLLVENNLCAVGSPEAMLQAEALLSNLVVQIANAVIQPLLNRFATHEVIKQSFYDRRLLSTREIERFRNALSAQYRLRRWFLEPKEMFESQYSLVIFSETGLQNICIYTSRDQELKSLSGLRLAVTLALEARDAIAPPLQATFTFLGRGVVYLLTQVVGRGLGLIGRGVLQGVGGTWQELFITRKSPQQK